MIVIDKYDFCPRYVFRKLKDTESKLNKMHPVPIPRLAMHYIQSIYFKDYRPSGENAFGG